MIDGIWGGPGGAQPDPIWTDMTIFRPDSKFDWTKETQTDRAPHYGSDMIYNLTWSINRQPWWKEQQYSNKKCPFAPTVKQSVGNRVTDKRQCSNLFNIFESRK